MDKAFPLDLYQALSYLMPGLALFFPVYIACQDLIDSALQKLGSITAIVLILPLSISLGIFLHAVSTSAQFQIEKAIGTTIVKRATMNFPPHEILRDRVGKVYNITLNQGDYDGLYVYARTIAMKDGGALKDRAQFFIALSVFCRSLILVSLIVGVTLIWRSFGTNRKFSLIAAGALAVFVSSLVYFKEMYFHLSINEILRAALLLTAPKIM
jgi:hypothetical protein